MNNYPKLLKTGAISVFVALFVFSGCGPRLAINPMPVEAPEDVVSTEGRGGYDWLVVKGAVDVASPTRFSFAKSIDKEKMKSNLVKHEFVEPVNVVKPAGMEDDVWQWYSRIDLNHAEPKPILEITSNNEIGVSVVAFNLDGSKLWTIGGKLIEWDVATGKRLRSYNMMIKNCIQAVIEKDGETIVLRSPDQILRVSLADGSMLGRWQPPKGTIESMAVARDADVIAVVTSAKELHMVSDNFLKTSMFPRGPLTSNAVAIHPTGRTILATTGKGLLRWKCKSADLDELYFGYKFDPGVLRSLTSGNVYDRGFIGSSILDGSDDWANTALKTGVRSFNGIVVFAKNATVDGSQDWDVLVYKKNDLPDSEHYIIDASFSEFASSVPWKFPTKGSSLVGGNSTFEKLAFEEGKVLRVYDRRRWVNNQIYMVTNRIAKLALDGRFKQLEICAADLRRKPWTRSGESGLIAYGYIAERIGWELGNIERNSIEGAFDQRLLDEWIDSGSELSQLASIHKHRSYGTRRSFSNVDYYPDDRVHKISKRLEPMLNQETPCFDAIKNFIECTYFSFDQEVQVYLKTLAENYPNESIGIASMCAQLDISGNREGHAMTLAVSKTFPADEAALFYVRVALDTAIMLREVQHVGFSQTKILMAAEQLLEQNPSRIHVEALLAFAQYGDSPKLIDRLANYYHSHFEVPSDWFYLLVKEKTRTKIEQLSSLSDKNR